ncbi:MAG: hypothetical protein PPP56_12040 [Longimonas sp.]|uniref:hypothetical protein n=1 Tax=Longimonas sp. TaxID=2039626 RepID=UPI003351DDE0
MPIFDFPFSASRWMRTLTTLFVGVALLVGLAACDSTDSNSDDDPDALAPETARVSIGDDGSTTLNAFFATGENPETGEEGFVVYLTESDDVTGEQDLLSGSAAFIAREGPRPSSGTYTFADLDFDQEDDTLIRDQFGFVYWDLSGDAGFPSRVVVSNSGELTISTSTNDQVTGSFEIEATAVSFSQDEFTEEAVSVSGIFDARRVNVLIPGVDF